MGVILLGKIKIHEIAKKIGVNSKEVLEKALELGLDVKSHMSSVDETDAKKIKDGMTFFIGKECYLKVGKYAIRLDLSQLSAPILFENFIKSHENEIETIFKPNGNALYKKEEN